MFVQYAVWRYLFHFLQQTCPPTTKPQRQGKLNDVSPSIHEAVSQKLRRRLQWSYSCYLLFMKYDDVCVTFALVCEARSTPLSIHGTGPGRWRLHSPDRLLNSAEIGAVTILCRIDDEHFRRDDDYCRKDGDQCRRDTRPLPKRWAPKKMGYHCRRDYSKIRVIEVV